MDALRFAASCCRFAGLTPAGSGSASAPQTAEAKPLMNLGPQAAFAGLSQAAKQPLETFGHKGTKLNLLG